MNRSRDNLSHTVGFRLPPDQHAALSARADGVGLSIHAYARVLVTTALDQAELLTSINSVRDEQIALRMAIARSLEAILINTTDLEQQDIRRFTREKLLADLHLRDSGTGGV